MASIVIQITMVKKTSETVLKHLFVVTLSLIQFFSMAIYTETKIKKHEYFRS
jgi:hypothetical protein